MFSKEELRVVKYLVKNKDNYANLTYDPQRTPKYVRKILNQSESVALIATGYLPYYLTYVDLSSRTKKNDSLFLQKVVANNQDTYEFLPKHLTTDKEFLMGVAEVTRDRFDLSSPHWNFLSSENEEDVCFVIDLLKINSKFVANIPTSFLKNKLIAKIVLSSSYEKFLGYGYWISFFEGVPEVMDDKELMLISLEHDPSSYIYMRDQFANDPEMAKISLSIMPEIAWQVQNSILSNKEVVLATVQKDGCAIEYFSDSLKGDMDVVEEALKSSGGAAYFYLNEVQRLDSEIIALTSKYLVSQSKEEICAPTGINYSVIPDSLMIEFIKRDPSLIMHELSDSLYSTAEFYLAILSNKDFVDKLTGKVITSFGFDETKHAVIPFLKAFCMDQANLSKALKVNSEANLFAPVWLR